MFFPSAQRLSRFLPWAAPSSLKQSTQLHAQLIVTGGLLRPSAATFLLRSITDCERGDLFYALRVLSQLSETSTFQWNTIIRAFCLHHCPEYSINLFKQMRMKGMKPDSFTYHFVFKSCARSSCVPEGRAAHGQFVRLFPDYDRHVPTSLVHMYFEFREVDDARKVFDGIVGKDVVLWTTMVTGLAKAGFIGDAHRMFDFMPERNVVSWTGMITGYSRAARPNEAIELFGKMLGVGLRPDAVVLLSVLAACAETRDVKMGRWIHQLVVKMDVGYNENLIVTLVDMYAKCGEIDCARDVFNSMARQILPAWNALIDGYCKMGDVDAARFLFDEMGVHTVVTFNSMITGYIQSSRLKEALSLFVGLRNSGLLPDKFTMVGLLSACASLCLLHHGKALHACIEVGLAESDIFLGTALIDMYAKCGKMEQAITVFDGMDQKDVMTWTALISGFAVNGMGNLALESFSLMQKEGIRPTAVAYIGVLNACSHSGLLNEGRRHFKEMQQVYGLEPEIEHYGCMIDLLGRLGHLEEAQKLIKSMAMKPSDAVWGSLLRSCRLYKNVSMAEWAAGELLMLEPGKDVGYVQLYNTFIDARRWDDATRIRSLMEERGVKKMAAFSSVAVSGQVHKFIAGDCSHPDAVEIQEMLREIMRRIKAAGYVPKVAQVSVDVDEEERELALFGHSERTAIAFGIIRLGPSLPIHVVKNLRVCDDCHTVLKLVAKLWSREIVVRDRSRFHHFRDGICSCNGFW